jgi:hypothetical protein
VQVYLNLSDQDAFVRAVAGDGRSYKKQLFDQAAAICSRNGLKSPTDIEQLGLFVVKVEEAKVLIEAEEDIGEIPDEFLGAYGTVFVNFPSDLSFRSTDVHHHARSGDPAQVTDCD